MDKDRIDGSAKQISGAIRRFFGRLLGDRKMRIEGLVEEEVGKAQNAVGGVKDAMRKK
ncbi:CsbD family protein [Roseovarius sp. MBR-6]|uniref:CsbD family protein n=1 Tax=Roseovarius sp. MBR-6 TaxID=3156459 RepID=UPI0033920C37